MLPIRFDDITTADIERLLELKMVERRTLEYKERLATGNREERAEFLSDVCSFANAGGGDIIFGISEERENGKPTGLPGAIKALAIDNPATECARMEQLIESGISPRVPLVQIMSLTLPDGGFIIVLRVGRSWIAPHMVTFSNLSRFFTRNSSTGKVQLDVQQIGAAFALQRGLGERLRDWKADRIAKALSEEGPVPLPGAKVLLHFIPASVLTFDAPGYPRSFDPRSWGRGANLMSFGSAEGRYNADGFLLASDLQRDSTRSYLQVFRNGALEYADSYALDSYGKRPIPSAVLEEKLAATFQAALILIRHLGVSDPIFVTISMLGVKGRTMGLPQDSGRFSYESEPFDRDLILCPDVMIDQIDGAPQSSLLLPLVNSIWQAAGREHTPYLNDEGGWRFV